MKRLTLRVVLVVFAVFGLSAGQADAQLFMDPTVVNSGSWSQGFGLGGDFDRLVFKYLGYLDTGAGMFESPFIDNFHQAPNYGDAGPSLNWGADSANSTTLDTSGDQIFFNGTDIFWWDLYFTGDALATTGFAIGAYIEGAWTFGATYEVGNGLFNVASISEAEFDAIPEPGTLTLLGIGIAVAAGLRRRKKA